MNLYNTFWKMKTLLSAHVTTWRVLENKIATKVNLARCGVVVYIMLCCLCMVKEKTTSYFFFECIIVWLVWNLCYAWLGLNSVDHLVPTSYFLPFNLFGAPTSFNLVFGNVWIVLVSEIWRHRNKYVFKGGVIDHSENFSMAQLKVWS